MVQETILFMVTQDNLFKLKKKKHLITTKNDNSNWIQYVHKKSLSTASAINELCLKISCAVFLRTILLSIHFI